MAVSNWQLAQFARALVPAAVLKFGLALLTTGLVPGVAPTTAVQVCVVVNDPKEQDVVEPLTVYPALHATWQAVPEEMTDEQLPSVPLVGAVTEHGFAAHVCAVNTPLAQDVAEPTRLYPEAQVNWQALPEAREVEQVPRVPFTGTGTAHELCAFAHIGTLSRLATSHQIIFDFTACIDAKNSPASDSVSVNFFAEWLRVIEIPSIYQLELVTRRERLPLRANLRMINDF